MADFKPNHICKNPKCKKHYYACDYCSRTLNWRSVACSFSCYQEYMDLVIAERSKGKVVEVTKSLVSIAFKHPYGIRKLMKNHKSLSKV